MTPQLRVNPSLERCPRDGSLKVTEMVRSKAPRTTSSGFDRLAHRMRRHWVRRVETDSWVSPDNLLFAIAK